MGVGSCLASPSPIPPLTPPRLPTPPHGGRVGPWGGAGVRVRVLSCLALPYLSLTISFLALPCFVMSFLVLFFLSFLAFPYFFLEIFEILII